MPRRKARAGRAIPKPNYGEPISGGMESTIYPVPSGQGLVHKVFTSGWISRKYIMGGKLGWITRKAHSMGVEIKDVQPPKYGRFGFTRLSPKLWSKITFILTGHSVDVMQTAKKLEIPVPEIFRQVAVEGKQGNYFVLEMSDLRKEGTMLVPGHRLYEHHRETPIANFRELTNAIFSDKRKLREAGFVEDIGVHDKFGGFIIRIDKETGKGERFLADASNFIFVGVPKK